MQRVRGKVLVLGFDDRAFLSVVRSLGRGGIEVNVGWHHPATCALRSRYIRCAHAIPAPDSSNWGKHLVELVNEEDFALVIPCHDQEQIPLQRNQDSFRGDPRFYLLNDRAFEAGNNKIESDRLARALSINVPAGETVTDADRTDQILAQYGFPIVLKPVSSYSLENLQHKRSVRKAFTAESFRTYLSEMLAFGPVLVQENFPGHGVGIEFLAYEGRLLHVFQHERVHEPLLGGGSSYRKSVPPQPELVAAAEAMARELDYTGVGMVEFKVDQDGRWVFIELNPRFWGSLPLALAAGADFPLYLYEMLVEGRRSFPQTYRYPLYSRHIVNDMGWMLANLRADRTNQTLATRPLTSIIKEVRNIVLFRERWDTFALDDPRPGLCDLYQLGRRAIQRLRRLGRRALNSTAVLSDIRRREAGERFRRAENVLFVCKGNICRSPFAEHYSRRLMPGGRVFASCGYIPIEGRQTPPPGVEAAAGFEIELSGHRSTVLDEARTRWADVIFVFDDDDRQVIMARHPSARAKVHYLGSLDPSGGTEIADPYGGTTEEFTATYGRIAASLERAAGL